MAKNAGQELTMILIPREVLHLAVKVRFADVSESISASIFKIGVGRGENGTVRGASSRAGLTRCMNKV
jgi:hypothetical protein